ncbi:hypothetical protein F5Y08DRAFT_332917 [Xylaria arbuscula]|nr:hypothetical protein F5Y08DRAFT_332917 [Xylaria arbuscula]
MHQVLSFLIILSDGTYVPAPRQAPSLPSSPLSGASTIDDGELSSPILPPLQAPRLPERALGYLRTPPRSDRGAGEGEYVTASWGSPYPEADSHHLRRLSFSSGTSEESPLHQLEIDTPFLRPVPSISETQSAPLPLNPSLSGSAAVLANRARRPLSGITEEWIRQHTTNDPSAEHRHWLSDGTDDSEHSSLSGSISSNEAGWFEEADPRTPRPALHSAQVPGSAPRRLRNRSSNETLRQAILDRHIADTPAKMESLGVERSSSQDAASIHTIESNSDLTPRPATPTKSESNGVNGLSNGLGAQSALPTTPAKPTKQALSQTPRLKKKVPWRGKNILVLIPRDDERGQPGKAPMPLDAASTQSMFRSWEELGYNIKGFDLDAQQSEGALEYNSQSRNEWPQADDIAKERLSNKFRVTLPDLNANHLAAWKDYVNELAEAKLRALGVTFAEEEPAAPPSISPVGSNMSRQASNQFPPFPFSPPLPPPSVASNGHQGFPFPAPFIPGGHSGPQSPAIPSVASPVSFNPPTGRFSSRASISVSPHELGFHMSGQPSPLGWSPQLLLQQQGLGRSGSPSMIPGMSPVSPFSPDGISPPMGLHQRHQSLQYPMLPHQFLQRQDSARASPRLQEVREDDEDETQTNPYDKSPSKTPEPAQFIQHNASNSLQKEIDEAEYHLEEQFRSQLEHEDYSPHNNEVEPVEADMPIQDFTEAEPLHARGPSVHFSGIGTESDEEPKLHHPQPHSRGHSLSQKPFFESDEVRDSTDEGSVHKHQPNAALPQRSDSTYGVDTNPNNLGTPAQNINLTNQLHQRSESIVSNPYAESESHSASKLHSRQASHNSKPSLSKLNANAAEFKFNPKNNFTPGQFTFGGANPSAPSFTPASVQAPAFVPGIPQSATSSHFSVPSNTSSTFAKINPTAPVFSPHRSDFSFSLSGPKFNPDAKAFQPMGSFASSLTSAGASGNESTDARPKSIFGNIDLNSDDYAQPGKKSKAIPIVRPSSGHSQHSADADAANVPSLREERLEGGASRIKKQFRNEDNEDGDDVPLFAEPTPEPESIPQVEPEISVLEELERELSDEPDSVNNPVNTRDEREEEDDTVNVGDVTFASTVVSETTDGKLPSESNDTKATTSPSAASPDPDKANWRPIEFTNETDIHDFNNARPFGDNEPRFDEHSKAHFSATAKPFVPGNFTFGTTDTVNIPFEPDYATQPDPLVEHLGESEEDRAGSPTPGPDFPSTVMAGKAQDMQDQLDLSPEPAPISSRGLLSSRFASPPPAPKGLKASRFAASPSASPTSVKGTDSRHALSPSPVFEEQLLAPIVGSELRPDTHSYEPLPVSPPSDAGAAPADDGMDELTFEQIDAVMRDINDNDPTMGVKRMEWHQSSPERKISAIPIHESSPTHLPPQLPFHSEGRSPSPPQYRSLPHEHLRPKPSTELEDPFIDPPRSAVSHSFDAPIRRLNADDIPESEWDDAFSASEQGKLEQRVHYFDGHVNELVGNLLASRLDPLENTLGTIQQVLGKLSQRGSSTQRDRRSFSAEVQESDADDEDEELPIRRSMSPKRDRRLEQIRVAVMDAMNQHQAARSLESAQFAPVEEPQTKEDSAIVKAIEDLKVQITENGSKFQSDDIRTIVEEAIKSRMPQMPTPKLVEMQLKSRIDTERLRSQELEERLPNRRAAEDPETKVEVEIMNRNRLKAQESKTDVELSSRRAAEDRLSEEEDRLRAASGKTSMRLTLLEAAQSNAEQTQAELKNRLNITDSELRDSREEARHWRSEAEQARDSAARQADDFVQAVNENKHFHKLIDTLSVQLEENERIRDNWRAKFEITEENSRRSKKEQALLAQARTRERLEVEVERLENGERAGMRAVSECKRLEGLLADLLSAAQREAQEARDAAMVEKQRAQLVIEEAKEAAAIEIQQAQLEIQETKESIAADLDRAQLQIQVAKDEASAEVDRAQQEVMEVQIAKADYEDEIAKLRAELDQVRMDADTANAHHEMMLEEAQYSKETELQAMKAAKANELEELSRKHQNELEDVQARYERQISNTTEDAQRTEQNLLERLSLSASKTEHLQDRVAHLEDKVQIAQEAAKAAAQAAAQASKTIVMPEASAHPGPAGQTKQLAQAMQLPEKISPQALRESIMVLQEQLQAREQRIEELEQTVSDLDPDAATKISKRDDEITWLRELLAVRHGDLQDIIAALSADHYDREGVKDAAIRLKANLQMEEQERERAMNGGSALNLPNIAATISKAATPRVAQAVGPLAAAWGSWRKSNQSSLNLSGAKSSPATGRNATPSKSNSLSSQNGLLSGLMTPPASGIRNTPQAEPSQPQPTAFGNTGRRFTAEQFANRSRGSSMTPRPAADKTPLASTPPPRQERKEPPRTPPMMQSHSYDDDAQMEEFDDASFFDD